MMNRSLLSASLVMSFMWSAGFLSPLVAGGPSTQPATIVKSLPEQLQEVSVTIKAARGEGSGVVVTRNNTNYVWTAAHVIAGNRSVREVVDSRSGTKRSIVEFKDLSIIQSLYEGGRKVGQLEMLAEVLRYSDADHGEDLAVLRIRKKNFIRASAKFYMDDTIPTVGTDLLHVGSLHGQSGSNSVTDGIISQHGRIFQGKVYDQTTVTAFPGSSGGGVYIKADGRYLGMITRGAGETFNLMVPIRRIRTWADRVGVAFTLDPTLPIPPGSINGPIEDTGHDFTSGPPSTQPKNGIRTWLYVPSNSTILTKEKPNGLH